MVSSSLFLVTAFVTFALYLLVTSIVDAPYMDEVFHIPQVQHYCAYNFTEWNPKITTLPGVYIISILLFSPVAVLTGHELISICSVSVIRLTNVLLWMANVWLSYCLYFTLNHRVFKIGSCRNEDRASKRPYGVQNVYQSEVDDAAKMKKESTLKEKCFVESLVVSLFPVLYFFTFLYYTDMASTFFVLLTYYCAISGHHFLSATAGAAAVLCRQTNIVWVGFSAAVAALLDVSVAVEAAVTTTEKDNTTTSTSFIDIIQQFVMQFMRRLKTLIYILYPYLVVLLGFLEFVYVNEGVVVGDRLSHQPAFHPPQLLYFYAFTTLWSFSQFVSLSSIRMLFTWLWRHTITSILLTTTLTLLCFISVSNFTIVHPYLRDDNRHVAFYVWRKLFARHEVMKYVWIPVYVSSILLIHTKLTHDSVMSQTTLNVRLSQCVSILWQTLFVVCTALPLVLQKLLEPRYFIMPYLVLRLHLRAHTQRLPLILEFLLYVLVNVSLLSLFLFVPFEWQHEPGIAQRFVW
ncbi:putative Dol-P-Glc:Glc(2)Man(9)GlcNAc(2)-PP-Dol alpha-1,2-glucosyltransferase [Corticium candelabrum]|uniref:putative Dol-P-Glc:Glc(2)Man(9)GlcNAc(2)-PP-Dol alpha-1,2-glucosyltransferase n=1 Tax=Corticium candelabrum TaxID=121492 RepID=UPI002E2605D2|nr:putative Dol-P-Glc:Glc(2)Man(9)GlcNAc(2)-PP-Dol alpha-1,2-glucosyltransferase [Corticium candelabrum]